MKESAYILSIVKEPVYISSVDDSVYINVKVWNQDDTNVWIRVKRKAELQKLMDVYSDKMGTDAGTYRFLLDGDRLRGTQTADEAGLTDGDQIDAMLEQDGGSGRDCL